MKFIFHWQHGTNFINNEGGKSAKNRLGHKSATLNQRIVLEVKCNKISKQLKKEIECEIISKRHFVRNGIATIYINNKYYTVNCRDAKQVSNDLVNLMLLDKFEAKANMDYHIKEQMEKNKLKSTMVKWC